MKYEPRFAKYGYSLTEGFDINDEDLQKARQIFAASGASYCLMADVNLRSD